MITSSTLLLFLGKLISPLLFIHEDFVLGDIKEQLLWVRGNSLHCEGGFSSTQGSQAPHQETSAPQGGGASNSSRINGQLWRSPGLLYSWPGSPEAWGQGTVTSGTQGRPRDKSGICACGPHGASFASKALSWSLQGLGVPDGPRLSEACV